MVKPFLLVSLKDPQSHYKAGDTVPCQVTFKSEKSLTKALIRIKLMCCSTSLSNGNKKDARTVIAIEKELPIEKNTQSNTLDFLLEVPGSRVKPSRRNLEENEEGIKMVEYLIEASLEINGFLKKKARATHVISVPLDGNVNNNENEQRKDHSGLLGFTATFLQLISYD